MPRTARAAVGGIVYHVHNRGNGRMGIFRKPGDYLAFLQLLRDGKERASVELFGFCLMPNHWHLVLGPRGDGDLSAYLSSLGCGPKWRGELLDAWPVDRPRGWTELVNEAIKSDQRQRILKSMERGRPLGGDAWTLEIARRLDLQYTLNPRGRPAKSREKGRK